MSDTVLTATPKTTDAQGRKVAWVDLDNPLTRGDQKVARVMLRKPLGGDLRGVKLVDVYNMDVTALSLVVPRISEPMIAKAEFMEMDGEDIASICGEVVGFLLTKRQKADAGLEA